MSQRTNLTRYLPLTSRNRAILVLRVRDVLLGSDLLTLRAQSGTYQPKVTVQFFGYGWCDDIEFTAEMSPRIS